MKRILKHIFVWMMLATFVNNIVAPKQAVYADAIGVSTATELRARFAENTGGDVRLDADITLEGSYAMRAPMSLDLNGHTLAIAETKTLLVYSDVTVFDSTEEKAGVITGNPNNAEKYIIQIGGASATGKFTLKSGNVSVPEDIKGRAVNVYSGEMIVGGGVVEAPQYVVFVNGGSKLTVNNGEVRVNSSEYAAINGAVNSETTINGGKVSAPSFTIYQAGKLTINNGIVEGTNGLTIRNNTGATFEMNGGKVITESDDSIAVSIQKDTSGVFNGGTVLAENGQDENKGSNAIAGFRDSNITINDGAVIKAWGNALTGNGSESGNSQGTDAKFTINGGKITSSHGAGIYAPQIRGETIINGGEIVGLTGIEIRAGRLEINGGKLVGTNAYYVAPNSNGGTTLGAAVAVAQHTTRQPIEVVINAKDSNFDAIMPFSFANPQEHSQDILDLVTLSIKDGTFNTINDGTSSVTSLQNKFITGGYYDYSVAPYIADGYYEARVDHNGKKMYHVVKPHNITIESGKEEYLSVSKNPAIEADTITVETNAPEGYAVEYEVKDALGNIIAVTDNKFIMPDMDVLITVILEKLPDVIPEVPDTGGSVTSQAEPVVTVSVAVGAIFGGFVGLIASRKKIKALFA